MAIKYFLYDGGYLLKSDTLDGIRKEAIRAFKHSNLNIIGIYAHDPSMGNNAWMTEKTVGYVKTSSDKFLWLSPKKNILGYVDNNGKIVKEKGLRFDRYYTLGVKLGPRGNFWATPSKYKTIGEAHKAAYSEIMSKYNTKAYPNYGPTTSIMISGHYIRSKNGYSYEEFVYSDNGIVYTVKLASNLTGVGKVYRLNKNGSLGTYVNARSLKQIHKDVWNTEW